MHQIVVYLYFIKDILQWIDCYVSFLNQGVNIEWIGNRDNGMNMDMRV